MINDMEVRKKVSEFSARHGDYVIYNGWIYHEDGATRDVNRLGPLNEPSKVLMELRKATLAYRLGKLEQAVDEFDELKAQLEQNPDAGEGIDENLRRLKVKQRWVRNWQGSVNEARELLEQLMPGYRSPEQREAETAHEAALAERRNRISGVNI